MADSSDSDEDTPSPLLRLALLNHSLVPALGRHSLELALFDWFCTYVRDRPILQHDESPLWFRPSAARQVRAELQLRGNLTGTRQPVDAQQQRPRYTAMVIMSSRADSDRDVLAPMLMYRPTDRTWMALDNTAASSDGEATLEPEPDDFLYEESSESHSDTDN